MGFEKLLSICHHKIMNIAIGTRYTEWKNYFRAPFCTHNMVNGLHSGNRQDWRQPRVILTTKF